jgi:hypothetical protein
MDNAQRGRAVDWAAWFAEYGFFAPERKDPPGAAPLLTGANVAYARSVAGEVAAWARRGDWEDVAHARLAAQGRVLRFVPDAVVFQNARYRLGAFCADRFAHGRDFARTRYAGAAGSPGRWMRLALSPVLPFVLAARVARAAASTRLGPFLRALPATLTFLAAWSLGEAEGYANGPRSVTGGGEGGAAGIASGV